MYRLVAFSAVCMVFVGCGDSGPPLGSVSGTVTMDGQPLANALVTFSPAEGGRSSTGKTDASGKYTLAFIDRRGALIGSHKVSVTTLQDEVASTLDVSSDDPAYANQAQGQNYEEMTFKETIPAKYNAKTELVEEVTSGSNTIDLELVSS